MVVGRGYNQPNNPSYRSPKWDQVPNDRLRARQAAIARAKREEQLAIDIQQDIASGSNRQKVPPTQLKKNIEDKLVNSNSFKRRAKNKGCTKFSVKLETNDSKGANKTAEKDGKTPTPVLVTSFKYKGKTVQIRRYISSDGKPRMAFAAPGLSKKKREKLLESMKQEASGILLKAILENAEDQDHLTLKIGDGQDQFSAKARRMGRLKGIEVHFSNDISRRDEVDIGTGISDHNQGNSDNQSGNIPKNQHLGPKDHSKHFGTHGNGSMYGGKQQHHNSHKQSNYSDSPYNEDIEFSN
ncbi:MAG: hypothetical protein GY821_17825 [Gammaproteobacteria bacterium]|nr:hypothetical protein [Gammaproteobacteria bacterium]